MIANFKCTVEQTNETHVAYRLALDHFTCSSNQKSEV